MLSSCGLSIQGAEGDLSRWGNTGRLLTQTRKFCILLFHEGVTGVVVLKPFYILCQMSSCLILKHAGSIACWFMPYHKLASLFPPIDRSHSLKHTHSSTTSLIAACTVCHTWITSCMFILLLLCFSNNIMFL